jgi:hypothetical protein
MVNEKQKLEGKGKTSHKLFKYTKKIEKLSKLHTIWRYKIKIVKKVEKSSDKMLKLSKNLNLTYDVWWDKCNVVEI